MDRETSVLSLGLVGPRCPPQGFDPSRTPHSLSLCTHEAPGEAPGASRLCGMLPTLSMTAAA
jgi:hypothetical protein